MTHAVHAAGARERPQPVVVLREEAHELPRRGLPQLLLVRLDQVQGQLLQDEVLQVGAQHVHVARGADVRQRRRVLRVLRVRQPLLLGGAQLQRLPRSEGAVWGWWRGGAVDRFTPQSESRVSIYQLTSPQVKHLAAPPCGVPHGHLSTTRRRAYAVRNRVRPESDPDDPDLAVAGRRPRPRALRRANNSAASLAREGAAAGCGCVARVRRTPHSNPAL